MDNNALLFELMADDNDFDHSGRYSIDGLPSSYHPAFATSPRVTAGMVGLSQGLFPYDDGDNSNLDNPFVVPSPDVLQTSQSFTMPIDSDDTGPLHWSSDVAASQNNLEQLMSISKAGEPGFGSSEMTSLLADKAAKSPPTPMPPARRPRKQNHACDQCRSAKRACNFRNDIAIYRQRPLNPCTTCISRGTECTVKWLETKKLASQLAKRRSTTSTTEGTTCKTSDSRDEGDHVFSQESASLVPSSDAQLVKFFSVRETCVHHFSLYVDVVDMPLSQFLLRGMMPRRYSLGVEALSPLSKKDSFANYSHQADQWVNSCWDPVPEARLSLPVAPHIFQTVSVLDAIFERHEMQNQSTSRNPREHSINTAYKWAALASASRFSLNADGDKTYCREFSYATWQRAKQTIFDNLPATGSFRLALALVIFGTVESSGPAERRGDAKEISTYALCEGVKRLHTLCRQARSCLNGHRTAASRRCFWDKARCDIQSHPAHNLPQEVQENLIELIAAVEWLVGFVHAARTVLSQGRIQPLSDELNSSASGNRLKRHDSARLLALESLETQVEHGQDDSLALLTSEHGLPSSPVTSLWRSDASDSTMMQRMKSCGILAIALWDVLARLQVASDSDSISSGWCDVEEIQQLCTSVNDIIRLYRTKFGLFDAASASSFQEASPEIRRMAAMIANDSDLGVLLYYKMLKTMEADLATQPTSTTRTELKRTLDTSREFVATQRLISATQISTFARARQGASPGLQGAEGLKAQIQDLAAHPYPAMVVQANNLAAIALSEELQRLVARTQTREASKVAANLDACLKALQALESSLVTFPDLTKEAE